MFGKRKSNRNERNYQGKEHTKQPVFSYRSSRAQSDRTFERGSEENPVEKLGLIAKIQYSLIILLIFVGVGYLMTLDATAQIKIDGPQTFPRDQSEYQQAVNNELQKSVLNRVKFTLNEDKIEQNVQAQFPEVQLLQVKTGLFRHKPVVQVHLAEPAARLKTPESTYVLDDEGRALFETSQYQANFDVESLVLINDKSGHQIDIGKPALTKDQINYAKEIIGQFEKRKIKIKEMDLEGGGLELYVHPEDSSYLVKFSFLNDSRLSCGAYFTIRDRKVPVSQYVDVRVPDRAYVK